MKKYKFLYEFKITPKGYLYINGKRVSREDYKTMEIHCKRQDTFLTNKGYHYKTGYSDYSFKGLAKVI